MRVNERRMERVRAAKLGESVRSDRVSRGKSTQGERSGSSRVMGGG